MLFVEKWINDHYAADDKYIEDIYFFEVNTKYISSSVLKTSGARFTNVLSAKKFVNSFLRTVCVSQTPSTYEFLKDFAKIFLNIVVTLRQGGGDLIFQKIL